MGLPLHNQKGQSYRSKAGAQGSEPPPPETRQPQAHWSSQPQMLPGAQGRVPGKRKPPSLKRVSHKPALNCVPTQTSPRGYGDASAPGPASGKHAPTGHAHLHPREAVVGVRKCSGSVALAPPTPPYDWLSRGAPPAPPGP